MTATTGAAGAVIVVDDDEFVRVMLARQLRALGFEALLAGDGPTGLQLAQERGPVAAIVCDLRMPGMDGVQFLRHLAKLQPDAAVLLVSAQDAKLIALAGELVQAHGLRLLGGLHKPVAAEDLARLLAAPELAPRAPRPPGPAVTVERLRAAIQAEEIHAWVQPKVQVRDGRLVGAEALARWTPPGGLPVPPGVFVPLAERSGLIDPLTDLIVREALRRCGEWKARGLATRIAINIAPATLHRLELPETIMDLAAGFGVDAEQVIVEVTESSVVSDEALSLEVLTRLRLRGITLSLDDFGTGYASLQQLKRLPFGELKIDRSFVAAMIDDADAARIVASTLRLARDLAIQSVTAEGVETEAQLRELGRLGCAHAQGYFIARPMPAADLPAWAALLASR